MTAGKKKSSTKQDKRTKSTSTSNKRTTGGNSKDRKSRKKETRTSSRMSEKSRSSQRKSVTKGLSPPKEKKSSYKNTGSPTKGHKSSVQNPPTEPSDQEIDQTQWEFSRFKEEAAGITYEDPNVIVKEQIGESTPFLAEQKQKMLIRGEHLKQKPMFTLFFLFLELIFGLTVLITWSFFLDRNELIPIILCYANILILIILVLIVFVVQFGRFNVVEEELDEDIRYRIPYDWKYWLCIMHLLCFFLICANITIGALDNDFDGGVIIMISGMPVMLILSAGHIFFALRPQG